MQATNGMPGNPVNIAGVNKNGQRVAQGNQTYGKELTEEELLKEHNQNKQLTQILIINF
jgi:hypothetical protein